MMNISASGTDDDLVIAIPDEPVAASPVTGSSSRRVRAKGTWKQAKSRLMRFWFHFFSRWPLWALHAFGHAGGWLAWLLAIAVDRKSVV